MWRRVRQFDSFKFNLCGAGVEWILEWWIDRASPVFKEIGHDPIGNFNVCLSIHAVGSCTIVDLSVPEQTRYGSGSRHVGCRLRYLERHNFRYRQGVFAGYTPGTTTTTTTFG